ncbi:MAG: PAS domain S-box protein [Vicinamibacterales bacterium]
MTEHAFHPAGAGNEILAAVLEASDDAIIATDLSGVVFTWNRGAERIYGYSAREFIGRSLAEIFAAGRIEDQQLILAPIAAGKRIEPHDTIHTVKGGQRIEVLLTVSPIRDAADRVVGAAATVRDMTAQRRAERALRSSEARGRAIIETAVDAIILIDRHARIEAFNPAAERLFGYRADEVLGRNVSMLMPEPYASEHDHYVRRYAMTGQKQIIGSGREVTAQRRDGTTFPIHLSVAELSIEGETKFTGIVRDLTERVKLEEKVREESGLVRLGELAAVLAHEVKNPLAAVSGAIQVLSGRLPSAEDREIVGEVLRRLDGLSTMVSDLLLFARPPKPRLATISLTDLVQRLVAFMRMDPAWSGVQIHVEGTAPDVLADGDLVKVALQNLLVNAVQATNSRADVHVRLHEDNGLVHIDVTDAGPGIHTDVQARLFTPFFTTKSRGTGLGLATVRRIAEAHHGTARILTSSPTGTSFRFSIPSGPVGHPHVA